MLDLVADFGSAFHAAHGLDGTCLLTPAGVEDRLVDQLGIVITV